MGSFRRLSIVIPSLLLLASLIGIYLTRDAMANLSFLRSRQAATASSGVDNDLVDQRPWQTIEALSPLAVSVEEKRMVHEAQRLADHEVDQAFAQALRQAVLDTRTLTGDALKLQQKITALQGIVKDDQTKIDALKAAATGKTPPGQDEIDGANAQLQLDTDELGDAKDDLARMIGDKRGAIQQQLTVRQAAMKKFDEQSDAAGAVSAVQSAKRFLTLSGRIAAWFDQRTRMDSIAQARQQALTDAAALSAQHNTIEAEVARDTAASKTATGQDRVALLARLHIQSQVHSILDDRIETQKQLAAIYAQWGAQVNLQHGIVLHLMLRSVAVIAFILLCSALLSSLARRLLERLRLERRNLITLRTIVLLTIQILTALIVLLAVFGAPSQLPTIIGFLTAGLTVVFQGFIVSFFGWFMLMGKNGVRNGDWVEIDGVGGEVIDVGLFRTTLLETGNWTDLGHPTGRRVSFMNSFAINSRYFNFSTTGQWLWDEIQVNVPAGPQGYQLIDAIHQAVADEIAADTKQADLEWHRATGSNDLGHFSVQPTVDLRPASSGVDVIVRYMTRANSRFATRNRIYQTVIDLMRKHEESTALPGNVEP